MCYYKIMNNAYIYENRKFKINQYTMEQSQIAIVLKKNTSIRLVNIEVIPNILFLLSYEVPMCIARNKTTLSLYQNWKLLIKINEYF